MLKSLIGATLALLVLAPANAVTVEQIISREHPSYDNRTAVLTIGRDGVAYLSNYGFVLRVNRDGTGKIPATPGEAVSNVTSNSNGVIATANAHFEHAIRLWSQSFTGLGQNNDFLVSDATGWQAPDHVEAGASGDFYGMDQSRNRIVRVSPTGKTVQAYPFDTAALADRDKASDFRVCEATQSFFITGVMSQVSCVGFDGKWKWQVPGYRPSGFDVDDAGNLYALNPNTTSIDKFAPDGHLLTSIKLQSADLHDNLIRLGCNGFRLYGGVAYIKLAHPTEMFEGYAVASGAQVAVVNIQHERLAMTYPSDSWTAGDTIPFTIDYSGAANVASPKFHVWVKPYGTTAYTEWQVTDGKLSVPMGASGLYQIAVSPQIRPLPYAPSEYLLHSWVKIASPNAVGTVNVLTPHDRWAYGRGESVPFQVAIRSASTSPVGVTIKLFDGTSSVALLQSRVTPGKPADFVVPAQVTSSLKPGGYWLIATAPNLTSVAQQIRLGAGLVDGEFRRIMYGDYGETFPDGTVWSASDIADTHVAALRKIGINNVVDRLGYPLELPAISQYANTTDTAALRDLSKSLATDPVGIAPEKAQPETTLMQVSAQLGATGAHQMAILLGNDAGLPVGTGLDPRTPEQLASAIKTVTDAYASYPSLHGWSWASNWWVGPTGANSATSAEQRAAYLAAAAQANSTGKWDKVLDDVSSRWLSLAPAAESTFGAQLKSLNPALATAAAASYRNLYAWPPVTFSNVDEVDLQAQWEQIEVPFHAPFNVDFYSRPGKPAWGHPEIWNDSGTGDQVLPTLFEMAMRGASGVGESGGIPAFGYKPSDPRQADQGLRSVYRALYTMLSQYGPWLNTLSNADQVAILADRRQYMLDTWPSSMPQHFASVVEAYTSCLLAHHAASIVFSDDVSANSLAKYKAVILVGQTYDLEPTVAAALTAAQRKGVKVLADKSCRPGVVAGFTGLDIAFDKYGADRQQASDDSSYVRFTADAAANVPALKAALDPVCAPDAVVKAPESSDLFTTVRQSESGRYLFLSNETRPFSVGLGSLWRVGMLAANKLPVYATVANGPQGDNSATHTVYDVLGMRSVGHADHAFGADMTSMPFRIFADLPQAIASVALRGPDTVSSDRPFSCQVSVVDAAGKPIAASVPVQVTLLSGNGDVLDTRYYGVGSAGAGGSFWPQRNIASQARSLVATELFSGITSRLDFKVVTGSDAVIATPASLPAPPRIAAERASGKPVTGSIKPAESLFGPHIKDIAISGDGSLAVANTFNWDTNTYGINMATGAVKWSRRVGRYFAFGPLSTAKSVAVQGFDFATTEGYHLYMLGPDGAPQRRFALYGLPTRATHRFVPSFLHDKIDNFAIAPDSSWVASAGDLGVAVWSADGKLLWKLDNWKTNRSAPRFNAASTWDSTIIHAPELAVMGGHTLLVGDESGVSTYEASSGHKLWGKMLSSNGHISAIRVSRDGKTAVALSTADGGRVYVLKVGDSGQVSLAAAIPTVGDDIDVSADGSSIAVASDNQLKVYSSDGGLRWSMPADDVLKYPRFSSDGQRIAASSVLGTLYVVSANGRILLDRDLGAIAAPTWTSGGDLVVGTWMGVVMRLDTDYSIKWRTVLGSDATQKSAQLVQSKDVVVPIGYDGTAALVPDQVPTSRVDDWGNAAAKPAGLTPNLLADVHATISGSQNIRMAGKIETLYDGSATPPSDPWVSWNSISWLGEVTPFNYVLLDAGQKTMHVTGLTITEDPAHPESWVRDAYVEAYNGPTDSWKFIQPLLSNTVTHTHWFAQPVNTNKLRIVLPYGVPGNLRMGEIVVHGTPQ